MSLIVLYLPVMSVAKGQNAFRSMQPGYRFALA